MEELEEYNYWIRCPLEIKEKIQGYLMYNMLKELKYFWKETYRELYGECDECKTPFDGYSKKYLKGFNPKFNPMHANTSDEEEFGDTRLCYDCANKTYIFL
jgi:hypothetical protein